MSTCLVSNDVTIDAVNRILAAVGDSPVSSIEEPTNVNVINAIKELDRVNRGEQKRGWSFNTISEYTLNKDTNTGQVSWSTTFLRLKDTSGGKQLVRKGDYLYNLTDQTFTFNSSITVEAVILRDFEEMPEAMQDYIIAKAANSFQIKYLGDPTLTESLQGELQEAWMGLQEYEMEQNDYNALDNPDARQVIGRW